MLNLLRNTACNVAIFTLYFIAALIVLLLAVKLMHPTAAFTDIGAFMSANHGFFVVGAIATILTCFAARS